ncbi:DMT family transporter [Megasphaera paucivorans]|uniref:Permease of the drug/metabolite transporter (DMT) superfamily n=1 Tax=Megasphaera paucivorans TaxID=349095 RepID=A0A1H0BFX0_9FIRM|nr:DMT family transporter [Megasphaera paucivorans]SDN44520.1 Permease of the drug/metabolite transporter (DMT) superfamily [Megasphaera paucivorans]
MFKTYFMLAFASAVWGFQPVCVKWLVAEWSPVTLTVIRYSFISLCLALVIYPREGKKMIPPKAAWGWLALMGFFGVLLNNVLQFAGLQYTTVTNCTLISATSPAVTALMAVFLIRERLSIIKWIGIFFSFAGVLAIVSDGSIELIRQIDFNIGDILCFASQTSWAIYCFISLKAMKYISAAAATLWFGLIGGLMTLVYGIAAGTLQVTPLSPLAMGSFVYMVFLGGLISLYFYNIGVKMAGPSISAIFLNIMPVVGMVSGAVLFNDHIGPIQLIGAAAIIMGVFLTTHHWHKAERV